jgi:predicted glutamine amidotransferase
MCRLLAIASRSPIDVGHHLDAFARACAASPEYQGHGWGFAVWRDSAWEQYRNVAPIWEDAHRPDGDVRILLAHARSAFRNEDIVVENNMPFISTSQAFIFNGELHGVRLPVQGRTGAHRIFQFIRNLQHGGAADAVHQATAVLRRRSEHIRACNFILCDGRTMRTHSLFSTAPEYFTLHRQQTHSHRIVCSMPYDAGDGAWAPMPNDIIEDFSCSF